MYYHMITSHTYLLLRYILTIITSQVKLVQQKSKLIFPAFHFLFWQILQIK